LEEKNEKIASEKALEYMNDKQRKKYEAEKRKQERM